MSVATRLPVNMTVEEFFDWCPEDNVRWQLVDGEPQAMAPTRIAHAALHAEVSRVLGNHLLEHRPGCALLTAPGVIPQVRASTNFRIPDLGVTCAPVAGEDRALREPVLLIEILSPSNRRDTWANVWAYTTIPSVAEILVLHSQARRAELLRRGADGTWPAEPEQVTDGDLALDSIGWRGPLAALYRGVPPAA